jgi:hypothetical protein
MFIDAPNFGRFMTRDRFEELRRNAGGSVYDKDLNQPWYKFLRIIDDFNNNRLHNIIASRVLTVDESISAYRPRTTKYFLCRQGTRASWN